MHDHCTRLKDLAKVQRQIIERHIERHKWFAQIVDHQEAKEDFVLKFGWIMRELYCGYICEERLKCEIAQQYLPQKADS